jgi:3-deoxy-D-manno-octulosonic acid (KDO) 8-phosphate synthase
MLFGPKKLLLIAGPCSFENERVCRVMAERLTEIGRGHPELRIVFKGSFGKANRPSLVAGADGLFIETYPKPEEAISDGPSQIPLGEMPVLIASCLALWKSACG